MNKKGFISIRKKLQYFSIILIVGIVGVFLISQGLNGWYRLNSTALFENYGRFSKYWNEMQEADRILYKYAQTPTEKENEECGELLDSLQKEASELSMALQVSEFQDMRILTEKYIALGNRILNQKAGTEERISWYNKLKEYNEILEGLYDTLYGKVQDYLHTELAMLQRLWQKMSGGMILLGIGMLSFLMWWIHRFSKQVTKPVQELTEQAEKITAGSRDLELCYHEKVLDELDILNNSFYRMVQTNNRNYDSLQKQKELKERLAKTKLRLLQSRVNPHFMFNTLNMIAGLAAEEDAERTTGMLIQTAKYLRYALAFLDKAVYLEDEISHAMDYMKIQKERFEDRFQIELYVEEKCKKAVVPSMILQPLCENALEYGMAPLKQTTTIRICAKAEENRLALSVEDNGAGMEEERQKEIQERLQNIERYDDTKGIGIVNTCQRIQFFYDSIEKKNGFVGCEVESTPLVKTRVCFYMPLLEISLSQAQNRLESGEDKERIMKLVLADDEKIARILLRKSIQWEKLGITLQGEAADGEQLLKLIEETTPDIVVTDIKMPVFDGLEIIAKTLEMNIKPYFLITSAYTSFEYARRAMKLGVEDFLPKPIEKEELNEALSKIADKINENGDNKTMVSSLVRNACRYIEEHYGEKLSLESISDQFYISPNYFSALFKKETGINFLEYLTSVRMQEAGKLLKNPQYSISEVAERTGYRDISHFSQNFSKKYGMAPSVWRRQQ